MPSPFCKENWNDWPILPTRRPGTASQSFLQGDLEWLASPSYKGTWNGWPGLAWSNMSTMIFWTQTKSIMWCVCLLHIHVTIFKNGRCHLKATCFNCFYLCLIRIKSSLNINKLFIKLFQRAKLRHGARLDPQVMSPPNCHDVAIRMLADANDNRSKKLIKAKRRATVAAIPVGELK